VSTGPSLFERRRHGYDLVAMTAMMLCGECGDDGHEF